MWSPSHIEKLIGVNVLFNKKAEEILIYITGYSQQVFLKCLKISGDQD